MARTSGRSYFTYKQIRAIIELEVEQTKRGVTRHGRGFSTTKLREKIQDVAQADGDRCSDGYVTRAMKALAEEGVLRKTRRNSCLALAPLGRRRLAASTKRYGTPDNLSPFKKSQFFKDVTVTSPNSSRTSISTAPNKTLSQKCTTLENLVKTLRASLRKAENASKTTSFELEETRRERDDLELTLRDFELSSSTSPFISDSISSRRASPGLTLRFDPPETSTPRRARSVPTVRSDRDSSPTPHSATRPNSPVPPLAIQRPTATFTHQPSGSFLNTISRQFTPSPSPGPIQRAHVASGSLNPVDDGENSDDDSELGPTDFGFADMGALEGSGPTESRMDVDSSAMQQNEAELKDALDKCQDLEAKLAVAEKNSMTLADIAQQLASTKQDRDTLNTQLASVTQERDVIQNEKAVMQEQLATANLGRLAVESEKARVSAGFEHATAEVMVLTARVEALTTELGQSDVQRDDANARLHSTTSQLEDAQNQLRATNEHLAATNVQLKGLQNDLCTFWNELQASNAQGKGTRAQLESAELRFRATRADLDMANTRLDSTVFQLNDTTAALRASNAQVSAATTQLEVMRNDLEGAWVELQISEGQHDDTKLKLVSANTDLETTNAQLKDTRDNLQKALQDVGFSHAELHLTRTQLDGARAELQTLQAELKKTQDCEEELQHRLENSTVQFEASQANLKQAIARASDRERYLETQLEDAQERAIVTQENLDRVSAAWLEDQEMKRLEAERQAARNEKIRHMLPGAASKRDASFRDSGVSFMG